MYTVDRNRTIEQLEDECLELPEHPSAIILTCHALRQKPLKDFSNEELRLMIGQACGLPYLIPMALERLTENPMISGGLYPGDLLKTVQSVDRRFWDEYPSYKIPFLQLAVR